MSHLNVGPFVDSWDFCETNCLAAVPEGDNVNVGLKFKLGREKRLGAAAAEIVEEAEVFLLGFDFLTFNFIKCRYMCYCCRWRGRMMDAILRHRQSFRWRRICFLLPLP